MHKPDGKKRYFKESRKGFFHDASRNDNQDATALVNTVEDKKNN